MLVGSGTLVVRQEMGYDVLVGLVIIIVACCEQYIELESLAHPYR